MKKTEVERVAYRCVECGESVIRKVTEPAPRACPYCGQKVEREVEMPKQTKTTKKKIPTQEEISKKRLKLNELAANFDELSDKQKKEHEELALEIAEMEDQLRASQVKS